MRMTAHAASLLVVAVAAGLPLGAARAGEDAPASDQPAALPVLGPSFDCPMPQDPLAQLICGNAALARADLAFVQAYQALRQQSPSQQAKLRTEAAEFSRRVRKDCGIGTGTASPAAATCVGRAYAHQRDAWAAELTGAAREEASRDLAQQVALQKDLQLLGLLPPSERINGVYGSATRSAITTFQQTMALPATGLLGEKDAAALARQAELQADRPAAAAAPPPPSRTGWENFQSAAAPLGLSATATTTPACLVSFDVRNPEALAQATRELAQKRGDTASLADRESLFAAELAFIRGPFAARGVHAFYDSQPASTDRCRFEAKAFTTDIYGRDVAQPLFSFTFDRATFGKIVWSRFDSDNLPRIAQSFDYGGYAQDRLPRSAKPKIEQTTTTTPAGSPALQPAATPARGEPAAAGDRANAPAPTILAWSGNALTTTRPFHVDGPWSLQWSSAGWFVAVLHQLGTENGSLAAHTTVQAASSAFFPTEGDFYLELIGADPWTVKIVPSPKTAESAAAP